jgi:putative ABC transport system permease protein
VTALLARLLGRLPIGWLQLKHNRARLFAAVGGVTFANVLIFMQLGFKAALFEASVLAHKAFDAEVVLVSSDYHAMRTANPLPRARMFQALSVPGARDATPVYMATVPWLDPRTGDTTNLRVIGVVPEARVFRDEDLQGRLRALSEPDTALIDRKTRRLDARLLEALSGRGEYGVEVGGRALRLRGTFAQGASFEVDGTLIVSEQTFLRLFPSRSSGSPNFVLVHAAGADPDALAAAIAARLPEADTRAFSKSALIDAEQAYQNSQTPIGFVFGFGVAIGLMVGLMMVYQVLATDVQDHLPEYATLKAVGYAPGFFLSIIFEEALCLALLGFVPGLAIAGVFYRVTARATALPISMPWTRPLVVLVLTAVMCIVSGAVATRRLDSADPADLF